MKWYFSLLSITAIFGYIVFKSAGRDYYMDVRNCHFYKSPHTLLGVFDLPSDQCSLIHVGNSSVVGISLDYKTQKVVALRSDVDGIHMLIGMQEAPLSKVNRLKFSNPNIELLDESGQLRKSFNYQGRDGEFLMVKPGRTQWSVMRFYGKRDLRYLYSYSLGSIGIIDNAILDFLARLK